MFKRNSCCSVTSHPFVGHDTDVVLRRKRLEHGNRKGKAVHLKKLLPKKKEFVMIDHVVLVILDPDVVS